MDSHGSARSTAQGPFAGRMAKAVVQRRDRQRALQQADDDDTYGMILNRVGSQFSDDELG